MPCILQIQNNASNKYFQDGTFSTKLEHIHDPKNTQDESKKLITSFPLPPLNDIHSINTAMPLSYWCGRYSGLADKARAVDPAETDEDRLERVLFEMELWCSTEDALRSFKNFKIHLKSAIEIEEKRAIEKHKKDVEDFVARRKLKNAEEENVQPKSSKKNKARKDRAQKTGLPKAASDGTRVVLGLLHEKRRNPEKTKLKIFPPTKAKTSLLLSQDDDLSKENVAVIPSIENSNTNQKSSTKTSSFLAKFDSRLRRASTQSVADFKVFEDNERPSSNEPQGPPIAMSEALSMFRTTELNPIKNINKPGFYARRVASITFGSQRFDPTASTTSLRYYENANDASTDNDEKSLLRRSSTHSSTNASDSVIKRRHSLDSKSLYNPISISNQLVRNPLMARLMEASRPESAPKELPKTPEPLELKQHNTSLLPRQTRTSILRASTSKGKALGPITPNSLQPQTPKRDSTKISNFSRNIPPATKGAKIASKSTTNTQVILKKSTVTTTCGQEAFSARSKLPRPLSITGDKQKSSKFADPPIYNRSHTNPKLKSCTDGQLEEPALSTASDEIKAKIICAKSGREDEGDRKIDDSISQVLTYKSGDCQSEQSALSKEPRRSSAILRIVDSTKRTESKSSSNTNKENCRPANETQEYGERAVLQVINLNHIVLSNSDISSKPSSFHSNSLSESSQVTLSSSPSSSKPLMKSVWSGIVESDEADISAASLTMDDSPWASGNEISPLKPSSIKVNLSSNPAMYSPAVIHQFHDLADLSEKEELTPDTIANRRKSENPFYDKQHSQRQTLSVKGSIISTDKTVTRAPKFVNISDDPPPRLVKSRIPFPVKPSPEALRSKELHDSKIGKTNFPTLDQKIATPRHQSRPMINSVSSSKKRVRTSFVEESNPTNNSGYKTLSLPRMAEQRAAFEERSPEFTSAVNPMGVAMDFLNCIREVDDTSEREEFYKVGTTLIENISGSVTMEKKIEEMRMKLTQMEYDMLVQKHKTYKMALAVKNWKDNGKVGPLPKFSDAK